MTKISKDTQLNVLYKQYMQDSSGSGSSYNVTFNTLYNRFKTLGALLDASPEAVYKKTMGKSDVNKGVLFRVLSYVQKEYKDITIPDSWKALIEENNRRTDLKPKRQPHINVGLLSIAEAFVFAKIEDGEEVSKKLCSMLPPFERLKDLLRRNALIELCTLEPADISKVTELVVELTPYIKQEQGHVRT